MMWRMLLMSNHFAWLQRPFVVFRSSMPPFKLLVFYSGPSANTLSSVAMEIIVALYLANVGSSTGKR